MAKRTVSYMLKKFSAKHTYKVLQKLEKTAHSKAYLKNVKAALAKVKTIMSLSKKSVKKAVKKSAKKAATKKAKK